MKNLSLFFVSLFLFASIATAQNGGTASNGDFQFSLTGATGSIQFDARLHGNGARGQMTFNGTAEISNEDDSVAPGTPTETNVQAVVSIDCLRIDKDHPNRAAMSGVVSSSNVPELLGRRALLAVEDNGEGRKSDAPDRFTWGVYRSTNITWFPTDEELPGDTGWSLSWPISDAERNDPPTASNSRTFTVDCNAFPFDSYAFEDLPHGAGNIQVKP